ADAIEIFFSTTAAIPRGSPPDIIHYQYGFNANDQRWNWCNMDGNTNIEPAYLERASSLTPEGYICEAAIEYGQMLSLDFSVGSTIGFHAVIDDTDNGDREIQMTWTSNEAHDAIDGFGHITFSDATIGVANPLARRPDPKDGALLENTWATLTWKPGPFAVTHDVYIGDNFDDVNNGAGDTFTGNHTQAMLVVGFPGFPVPGGLTPGTTYYWRVDEVNDANAASPWKGDIWSFSILPNTASEPDPADGAEFVDLDAAFSWKAGYGAKLHTWMQPSVGRQGTAPNCTMSTSARISTKSTMASEPRRRAPRASRRPSSNRRRSITGASMSLTRSIRTKVMSGASQRPALWAIRSRPTVQPMFR
ncbi:MAG: sugar-binding protein, partial [Planctomycetota bacterium]